MDSAVTGMSRRKWSKLPLLGTRTATSCQSAVPCNRNATTCPSSNFSCPTVRHWIFPFPIADVFKRKVNVTGPGTLKPVMAMNGFRPVGTIRSLPSTIRASHAFGNPPQQWTTICVSRAIFRIWLWDGGARLTDKRVNESPHLLDFGGPFAG